MSASWYGLVVELLLQLRPARCSDCSSRSFSSRTPRAPRRSRAGAGSRFRGRSASRVAGRRRRAPRATPDSPAQRRSDRLVEPQVDEQAAEPAVDRPALDGHRARRPGRSPSPPPPARVAIRARPQLRRLAPSPTQATSGAEAPRRSKSASQARSVPQQATRCVEELVHPGLAPGGAVHRLHRGVEKPQMLEPAVLRRVGTERERRPRGTGSGAAWPPRGLRGAARPPRPPRWRSPTAPASGEGDAALEILPGGALAGECEPITASTSERVTRPATTAARAATQPIGPCMSPAPEQRVEDDERRARCRPSAWRAAGAAPLLRLPTRIRATPAPAICAASRPAGSIRNRLSATTASCGASASSSSRSRELRT